MAGFRIPVRLTALVIALLVGACGGSGSSSSSGASPQSDAELAYGKAAPRSPQGITYQPDVVVVDGGPQSVRAESGDSLTWRIAGDAGGASDLKPGVVLFLTGRAVGRVLSIDHAGSDLEVTLGPVDLTDVIKDGDITVHEPVDTSAMVIQPMPDRAGNISFTSTGGGGSPSPGTPDIALPHAALAASPPPMPPPVVKNSTEVTVGPFAAEFVRSSSDVETKLSYNQSGVVIGAIFKADLAKPVADAHVAISGGKVVGASASVSGITGLSATINAGSAVGLSGNFKSRLEFPAELNIPLEELELPLNLTVTFKTIIETAFSAKNSTVASNLKWAVNGPIGFVYDGATTTLKTPAISDAAPPLDSVSGISVGVNGIVFAEQLKVLIGFGTEALQAGPFTALTVSEGLTVGSNLGIVQCEGVSFDVIGVAGLGFNMSAELKDILGPLIKKLTDLGGKAKTETELGAVNQTLLHESWVKPKVPACGG